MPARSTQSATLAGATSMATPRASSRSAEPHCDVCARFPCLHTLAPAPATTIAALVVAGAGAKVCKHGNRAQTSQCGSADLLEALGVAIDVAPARVADCVDRAGMGFCYAPRYHPAFRHV